MRLLIGSDLAAFIKERQAYQVRGLRQAHHVTPTLAIVQTGHSPITQAYVKLKQAYAADIGVVVQVHRLQQGKAAARIKELNVDPAVHGIIVQLPLAQPAFTDELLAAVDPRKDIDGLGPRPAFDPATPTAIHWLLAGFNIELKRKKIVIVGQGRLVGGPLAELFRSADLDIETADAATPDLGAVTREADVLITATGQPGLITSEMIKPSAVVVDAGTATDADKIVGDLADDVRQRDDLTITPPKGGVGPLTVCALFENVLEAARRSAAEE